MKTEASLFLYVAVILALLVPAADADLHGSIRQILARESEKNVRYGIYIIDAASGRKLYAKNAESPMTANCSRRS